MKTFDIKDEELYTRFKAKCVMLGKSMTEVITELIAEFVKKNK